MTRKSAAFRVVGNASVTLGSGLIALALFLAAPATARADDPYGAPCVATACRIIFGACRDLDNCTFVVGCACNSACACAKG